MAAFPNNALDRRSFLPSFLQNVIILDLLMNLLLSPPILCARMYTTELHSKLLQTGTKLKNKFSTFAPLQK